MTKKDPRIHQASEFMFSCQTKEGDFRGMIGNQYATYYTGAFLAMLINAGFAEDIRVEKGLKWLLSMRQDDGGWTIPILTWYFDRKTQHHLTSEKADPVMPDRTKPFSHHWTDMVLRGFAAHPRYRTCKEARVAGELLKSRFFQRDSYDSYRSADYWVRFAFWWSNILTAMESLYQLGFHADDKDMKQGMQWFLDHQQSDGLWNLTYVPGKTVKQTKKNQQERAWLSLRICRLMKHLNEHK
jgi:hypothetical protein